MRSGFKVQVYGTIIIQIEINISAGLIPANYKSPHKEQVRIHPDAGVNSTIPGCDYIREYYKIK